MPTIILPRFLTSSGVTARVDRPRIIGAATNAVMKAFQDHNAEKASKAEAEGAAAT